MTINYNLKTVTTTTYLVQDTDEVVFVNVAGPASVVLPNIAVGKFTSFYIKDSSGNARENPIFITAIGGEPINGVSFAIINGNYSQVQIVWDGVDWQTISN